MVRGNVCTFRRCGGGGIFWDSVFLQYRSTNSSISIKRHGRAHFKFCSLKVECSKAREVWKIQLENECFLLYHGVM